MERDGPTAQAPTLLGQQQQQQQQQGGVSNEELMGMMQRKEREDRAEFSAIRTTQTQDREWTRQQFEGVKRNQRSWGGTIGSALGRQDANRRARQREHNAAAAAGNANANRANAANTANPPRTNNPPPPPPPPPPANRGNALNRMYANRTIRINANLSKNLRSLYMFHEEYVHGIGENLPAMDFTNDERNRNKGFAMKYGRRKLIWKTIEYLMNNNYTTEAAVDKIIEVYGTSVPGQIITAMKNEQKNPNLTFVGSQRMNPRIIVGGDNAVGGAAAALAQMGINPRHVI